MPNDAARATAEVMPKYHRFAIEDQIERLIALLDAIDGDCDLEPSLGFSVVQFRSVDAFDLEDDAGDACEEVCEDEGAQCDDEGDFSDSGVGDADGLAWAYAFGGGGLA